MPEGFCGFFSLRMLKVEENAKVIFWAFAETEVWDYRVCILDTTESK